MFLGENIFEIENKFVANVAAKLTVGGKGKFNAKVGEEKRRLQKPVVPAKSATKAVVGEKPGFVVGEKGVDLNSVNYVAKVEPVTELKPESDQVQPGKSGVLFLS